MLVIGNGRLVTRDQAVPFYENGAVAMDGGTNVRVGPADDVRNDFPQSEKVDASGS